MSIFDVLTNGSLGSVIDSITQQAKNVGSSFGQSGGMGSILDSLGQKTRDIANNVRQNTPGGLGGLAGAGALGALLGNVLQGDLMKSVALAGAGAVAWNFYKKWAAQQGAQQEQQSAGAAAGNEEMPAGWGPSPSGSVPAVGPDPVAELVMRAMIYAARSDGNIDATERERINQILHNMLPGQDLSGAIKRISAEMIDPNRIAVAVTSPEQADDIYRLSCSVIDIDHFMETSYLQTLAQALGIDANKKREIEAEADQARRQLMAMAKQSAA